MYQEILFVNQDVCFLNQEERRQFLIISVSEGDWKREHKLQFKMASNRFYIPNVNEFFEGLISLLQQCGDCERKYRWGAQRISCKASRGISTHFSGDVWSSYGVGPGLLQQNQLTQDSDNELQITVTFIMKAIQKSQVLRRIHSGVTGRMLLTILSRCRTRRKNREKLCRWPCGIPNSCLRRLSVLGDIPSILAISTQRKPNAALCPWICSCLISYLGLSALPDLSRVNNCEFCVVLDLFCSALIMKVTV